MSDWVQRYMQEQQAEEDQKGGPGSGHHGHAGRPGKVGGSVPGKGGGSNLQVAETIINQLGGSRKLAAMIGARDFVGSSDSVQFKFKGSRKANTARIVLDPNDTYTLELWKINTNPRNFRSDQVFSSSGLYADALRPTFERETGLYLSL